MKKYLPAFLLLFTLWLCLSGYFTPFLLALGVISAISVTWISARLSTFDSQGAVLVTTLKLYRYIPWLLLEIVKSNLHVAKIILAPEQKIDSRLLQKNISQTTDIGRTIHANSITLTPGTISIDIQPESISVHALTQQTAQGIISDAMNIRVSRLEN